MSDVSVAFSSGTREAFLVTYPLPYDIKVCNDGADANRSLLVVVQPDGVGSIALSQPAAILQMWKDAGFECRWPTAANPKDSLWCDYGSLASGEEKTLRVFVQFAKAGQSTINVSVQSSPLDDVTPDNNHATRDVKILQVP
jgi:hypothetical protein